MKASFGFFSAKKRQSFILLAWKWPKKKKEIISQHFSWGNEYVTGRVGYHQIGDYMRLRQWVSVEAQPVTYSPRNLCFTVNMNSCRYSCSNNKRTILARVGRRSINLLNCAPGSTSDLLWSEMKRNLRIWLDHWKILKNLKMKKKTHKKFHFWNLNWLY